MPRNPPVFSRWVIARERINFHARFVAIGMLVGLVGLVACMAMKLGGGLVFFMLVFLGAGAGSMTKRLFQNVSMGR